MTRRSLSVLFIAIVFLGLLFGYFSSLISNLIISAGEQILSEDVLSDYFIGIAWGLVILFFLLISWIEPKEKKAILTIWLAKCAVTLGAMLVYEKIYGLDAFYYYHLASAPYFDWNVINFGEGTQLVPGISWVFIHVLHVGNSYHGLKVIFSFFGLMAVYLFYLACSEIIQKRDHQNLYWLGLFPSVLFWSSIYGKDPLNLLAIAVYFYGVTLWVKKQRLIYLILAFSGLVAATSMRSWYVIILSVPLFVLFLQTIRQASGLRKPFLISLMGVFVIGGAYGVQNVLSKYHFLSVDSTVAMTNHLSHSWQLGGSAVTEIPNFTSLGSMVAFAPIGIFTALFRPLPGEVLNGFGLLAGLENAFLIYLVVRYIFGSDWRTWMRSRIGFWAVTLLFSWSILYAFISPQNLGSAVRFRLQILPVLLILILIGKFRVERAACAE